MIDTIIFDLDGVLINSKNIHFESLNRALSHNKLKYQISYEDHLKSFDGLPTSKKLEILNKKKLVPKRLNKKIKLKKNQLTRKLLKENLTFDKKIYSLFQKLSKKYKIGIATNAIEETLQIAIKKLRIGKFVKFSISTENIKNSKPHPEIYLRSIVNLNSKPKNTLVLEDSHNGRISAKEAGARLMPIKSLEDVTYKNITNFIENKKIELSDKIDSWDDDELNIVIPMAGEGSRFTKAGYTFPKPMIEIHQKPMIQLIVESLGLKGNFIFIVRQEHLDKYNLKSLLNIIAPNCKIIVIDKLTEGAACTVLLAKKYINNGKPLIIANSDQFIEWNPSETMYNFSTKKIDGGILTFDTLHPKWSYAKVDKNNIVTEVAEKKVISNHGTVGVYYWKKGQDFVKYAEQMIDKNIRVNNEFYVCPVFNEAIVDKKVIKIHNVDSMWGLGTPEDLDYYLKYYNKD
jgi:HAD superfamily hydrolase (TIGR01509 family)